MKKNIFFISSYFYPERGAGAVRAFEFVKAWCDQYDVDVFTNVPNYPMGIPYKGYELKFPKHTDTQSFPFTIHRVFTVLAENKGFIKRSLSYLLFCISTFFNALFYKKKPNIVISTTPQLLTSLAGVLIAKFYRVPFVIDVRDLWPEAIIESGVSLNNVVLKILKLLSSFAYQSAMFISVTTEAQKKKIVDSYQVHSDKVLVVANGYNAKMFKPIDQKDKRIIGFKKMFGKHNVSIGYVGNLAFYYDFDVFFKLAQDFKDINFVIMGDGSQKKDLKYKLNKAQLSNLTLLDSVDYEDVPYVMTALDMGIVKHKDHMQITKGMRPVKLYEYVACNTPCIYYGEGEGQSLMYELGLKQLVLNADQNYEMLKEKIETYDYQKPLRCNQKTLKSYAREHLAVNFQKNIIHKAILT